MTRPQKRHLAGGRYGSIEVSEDSPATVVGSEKHGLNYGSVSGNWKEASNARALAFECQYLEVDLMR